jgi:hypothetical protein
LQPIGAEAVVVPRLAMLYLEQQWCASIPVPHLRGVDAVPARHLTRPEQVKDRSRVRAALVARLIAEGLAKEAAFRMWLQLEVGDDLVCGKGG